MADKYVAAVVVTVAACLIGGACTYTRLLSKDRRKNLEKKTWFKLAAPFALTYGIIHVVAAAGSIFAAMVLAVAYAGIEVFFARDKIWEATRKYIYFWRKE